MPPDKKNYSWMEKEIGKKKQGSMLITSLFLSSIVSSAACLTSNKIARRCFQYLITTSERPAHVHNWIPQYSLHRKTGRPERHDKNFPDSHGN